MGERRCRYCQKIFQPSKYQPPSVGVRRSRIASAGAAPIITGRKIAADPEYREVCRDSPRKWRCPQPGLLEASIGESTPLR